MKWSLHYLETAAPEKAPLPKGYLHTFPPKFTAEKTISGWRKVRAWQRVLFRKKLKGDKTILYVISEKELLALLPDSCIRVLITASLDTIKTRFSARMHGNLPAPVAAMLERKYGQFEKEAHDLRIDTDLTSSEEACAQILALLPSKSE